VLSHQEITDLGLSQMSVSHPELDTLLEQVCAPDNTQESIVREFRTVLTKAEVDGVDPLSEEFATVLDDLWSDQADKALEQTRRLTGQLAYFDLSLLPNKSSWYWSLWNLIGLLVTTVFVSLGAPFWFRWLSFLSGLRDALKPKTDEEPEPANPPGK
jgi:hypothetical protein